MEELKKLFPSHFMGDEKTNLKYKVVKTPRSVYKQFPMSRLPTKPKILIKTFS